MRRAGVALLVIASILALSVATQANAAPTMGLGLEADTKQPGDASSPFARRLMKVLGFVNEAGEKDAAKPADATKQPAAAPGASTVVPEQKPAAAAPQKPAAVPEQKPAAAAPQQPAAAAPQKPAAAAPQKPAAPEQKPAAAAPQKPAAPEQKPAAAAPQKPEAPEQKPAAAAPQKPAAPEQKPAAAAPQKPAAPEQKPAAAAPQKPQQAPRQAAPAPRQAAPAPRQAAPAPRQATPAPRQAAPAPRKPTLAPRKATPAPTAKRAPSGGSGGDNLLFDFLSPYDGAQRSNNYYHKEDYHHKEEYHHEPYYPDAHRDGNKQYNNYHKEGEEYHHQGDDKHYYGKGEEHHDRPYYPGKDGKEEYHNEDSHYDSRYKSEAPRRPGYDHRGDEPEYQRKHYEVPEYKGERKYESKHYEAPEHYKAPEHYEPEHKYEHYEPEHYKGDDEAKHGYYKDGADYYKRAYETLHSGRAEEHSDEYKSLSRRYEGLKEHLKEDKPEAAGSALDELKAIYEGMKAMFEEMRTKMAEKEVQEKLKDLKEDLEEEEADKEAPLFGGKKAEESFDKFADGNKKPEDMPRPVPAPAAPAPAPAAPAPAPVPLVETKPVNKWAEKWEADKEDKEVEEKELFGGQKYDGKSDKHSGAEGDKYSGEYEHERKVVLRRRKPRFVPGVPDPASPDTVADPKCHINFAPFYNEDKFKFACLGEKNRTLVEGTPQRPTKIVSEITCCDPEQNLGYPGKYGQYPESLTSLELATPAGTCTFTFTYFDTPDLSKDGLCVGSVEAVCHLERPCHVTDHPLDFTLHGVVKAKPAKIKVDTQGSEYYSSYGEGDLFLPGTSLIAYITDAPTSPSYDYGYDGGKVLLKYVMNWYNDDGAVLPNVDGSTDSITPNSPVEVGSHHKLPIVEPGTYGLFIKHGYYGPGYNSYDYNQYNGYNQYKQYNNGPEGYNGYPNLPSGYEYGPDAYSGPKEPSYGGSYKHHHKYGKYHHKGGY